MTAPERCAIAGCQRWAESRALCQEHDQWLSGRALWAELVELAADRSVGDVCLRGWYFPRAVLAKLIQALRRLDPSARFDGVNYLVIVYAGGRGRIELWNQVSAQRTLARKVAVRRDPIVLEAERQARTLYALGAEGVAKPARARRRLR